MTLVSLRSFLREAGLVGYEHALKEAGITTANDILDVEKPLELLELSCLEEQCVAGSPISCCSCSRCTLHAARCTLLASSHVPAFTSSACANQTAGH